MVLSPDQNQNLTLTLTTLKRELLYDALLDKGAP